MEQVKERVAKLEKQPHLVVILVGENSASKIYVNNTTEGLNLLTDLVGKKVPVGTEVTIRGTKYTTKTGAEIFNNSTTNFAVGAHSHAEGISTNAIGDNSHAEGASSFVTGANAHGEGAGTTASGGQSHAEGVGTIASGANSHAEGASTNASGDCSHAEGYNTKASSSNQHVQGKYNVEDAEGKYAFIIGNGSADSNGNNEQRSNAFAIDWNGNIYVNNASTGVNVATLASDLASLQTQIQTLTDRVATLENA